MGINHKNHEEMWIKRRNIRTRNDGLTTLERKKLMREEYRINRIAKHIKDAEKIKDVAAERENAKEYADRNGISLSKGLMSDCAHAMDELGISARHALMLAKISPVVNSELYFSEHKNFRYAKISEIANALAGRGALSNVRESAIINHWQKSTLFTEQEKDELLRAL